MTLRRGLLIAVLLVAVGVVGYTAWLGYQVQRELRAAEQSASAFQAALESGDRGARSEATEQLAERAARADHLTAGRWWGALTHLPFVGDDAAGVRALSGALDLIATEAVQPLGSAVDDLDALVTKGRVDLEAVASLAGPVSRAERALAAADGELQTHESRDFVGVLAMRYDEFATTVHGLSSGLTAADTAVRVLPAALGGQGARSYLVLFQNNAEIRATGGLPGSWAVVDAAGGRLSLGRQGAASDFPVPPQPIAPLSRAETAVYSPVFGRYFHNPGFTPDFPRAVELWEAHWRNAFPEDPIDGVIAIDPVAISYLLDGTGAIEVGGTTLTEDNVVSALLSEPYLRIADPAEQDAFFQDAARALFDGITDGLASPLAFLEGLHRAAGEGRLLVSTTDAAVQQELTGTAVEGALSGDDGATPHLDVGLNDLTGSKMSYYLRYDGQVSATSCEADRQRLVGGVTLRQVIAPARAAELPDYVTGGQTHGLEPGTQYVMVRIYGPYGGSLDEVRLDGRRLGTAEPVDLDGRPVVSIDVLLTSQREVRLSWLATTGEGQTGDGAFSMTPSVVPGDDRQGFASAC